MNVCHLYLVSLRSSLILVASGTDEKTLKREGVCAASLPTTMSICAGFLVQNTLKLLLDFGVVSIYQGYNALLNHFPVYDIKPNTQCSNNLCRAHQQTAKHEPIIEKIEEKLEIQHDSNDWGIEVLDEDVNVEPVDQPQTGLTYLYSQTPSESLPTVDTENKSTADLLKELSSLSS